MSALFCDHQWKCDPQGHSDGYHRSVFCSDCKSQSRSAEGPCAEDCQAIYKPGAIYFMGMHPELKDDSWEVGKRCTCTAQANIRITVKDGVPTAECPVCHQAYTVMVEGPGRGDMWPVHPGQII